MLDIVSANVYHECMVGDKSLEQQLIEAHSPDTPVAIGETRDIQGTPLTLGFITMAESLLCPGDTQKREDPEIRARKLAGMLAATSSLKPEFAYLLQTTGE